jgi:hypothetical protein
LAPSPEESDPLFFLLKRKIVGRSRVEEALQRAVAALAAMQAGDGSFPLSFRKKGSDWESCDPIFSTLTVMLAVGSLLPATAIASAVEYVLRRRSQDGLWEFDIALRIPADSDVTACALIVLVRHGQGLTAPADSALLRSFWREDGGPFRTWAEKSGFWHSRDRDDAVVNGNILTALKELGSPPTATETEGVLRLVRNSVKGTRYYCSPATIGYALCRSGVPLTQIPEKLAQRPSFRGGMLAAAQWLSAVRRWDDSAISLIVDAQSRDGSWAEEKWFTGEAKIPIVWGSAAISTALCAEALKSALGAADH